MRRPRKNPRRLGVAVTAVAALLIGPAGAQAEVKLSASSSPDRVTGAPPWTGTYRLTIATGDKPARLTVYAADGYSGAAALAFRLTPSGAAAIEAQGAGSASGPFFPDPYTAGGIGPCIEHGPDSGGYVTATIRVPANSEGAVDASQTLSVPPFPGDSLAFRFSVSPAPAGPGEETVAATQLPLPGPDLAVARGVRIAFSSPTPRSQSRKRLEPRTTTVRTGHTLRIAGQTMPPLTGQKLALVERPRPGAKPRRIARVTVGNGGRFAYDGWAPSTRGAHLLDATYRSQRPGLAASRTRCGPIVIAK
jgi:hypothetical protein